MNTFKVQKIRFCTQCGILLAKKCKGCIAHPERKPKPIVLHDWPKILQICPSGHCIRIACQRPGCGNENVWRNLRNGRGGKSIYEESFCSRQCNLMVRAAEKESKVMVRCSWDECDKSVARKPSEMKRMKRAFCHQAHYFLKLRKEAYLEKEAKKLADSGMDGKSLLECRGTCRGITDHHDERGAGVCDVCGTRRTYASANSENPKEYEAMTRLK